MTPRDKKLAGLYCLILSILLLGSLLLVWHTAYSKFAGDEQAFRANAVQLTLGRVSPVDSLGEPLSEAATYRINKAIPARWWYGLVVIAPFALAAAGIFARLKKFDHARELAMAASAMMVATVLLGALAWPINYSRDFATAFVDNVEGATDADLDEEGHAEAVTAVTQYLQATTNERSGLGAWSATTLGLLAIPGVLVLAMKTKTPASTRKKKPTATTTARKAGAAAALDFAVGEDEA